MPNVGRCSVGWLALVPVVLYAAVGAIYTFSCDHSPISWDFVDHENAIQLECIGIALHQVSVHGTFLFRLASTSEFALQIAWLWAGDLVRFGTCPLPRMKVWFYVFLALIWCFSLLSPGPCDDGALHPYGHLGIVAACVARTLLFAYCLTHVALRWARICPCLQFGDWRELEDLPCHPGRDRMHYLAYHILRRHSLLLLVNLPIGFPLRPFAGFACVMRGSFSLLLAILLGPMPDTGDCSSNRRGSEPERETRKDFNLDLALRLCDFANGAYYRGEAPPFAVHVHGASSAALNGEYCRLESLASGSYIYKRQDGRNGGPAGVVARAGSKSSTGSGSKEVYLRATPQGEWEISSSFSFRPGVRWAFTKDRACSPDRIQATWQECSSSAISANEHLQVKTSSSWPDVPRRFEQYGACDATDMHWVVAEELGPLAAPSKLGLPAGPEAFKQVSIVIAFRGTASMQNLVTDLRYALRPLQISRLPPDQVPAAEYSSLLSGNGGRSSSSSSGRSGGGAKPTNPGRRLGWQRGHELQPLDFGLDRIGSELHRHEAEYAFLSMATAASEDANDFFYSASARRCLPGNSLRAMLDRRMRAMLRSFARCRAWLSVSVQQLPSQLRRQLTAVPPRHRAAPPPQLLGRSSQRRRVAGGEGPDSDGDWAEQADAALDSARVHSGFLQAYSSVRENILGLLRERLELCDREGFSARVYVTGHSLGAAIACLCALDIAAGAARDAEDGTTNVGPPPPVTVYTFGSPKPGNWEFRDIYNVLVPDTLRVSTPCDFVTGVPLDGEYKHVGREVWLDNAGGMTFAMSWAMQAILPERTSVGHHWMTEYYRRLNRAFVRLHGFNYASAWGHLPNVGDIFEACGGGGGGSP